jgi:hypothetical protein
MPKLPVLLFAVGSVAFCQSDADSLIRKECKPILLEGLNYSYNSRYARADEKFDEYRACDPADPIGDWRKAVNWYSRVRAAEDGNDTPRVDSDFYLEFKNLVQSGIRKADVMIAKREGVDLCLYVESSLNSVAALMAFKNEGWLASFRMIKAALAYAGRSRYQDARYILGTVDFQTSAYPNFLKRKAAACFLPHDRCGGLALIQSAEAGNAGIFSDDIRMVMISIALKAKGGELSQCAKYHPNLSADALFLKYPGNGLLRKYLAAQK